MVMKLLIMGAPGAGKGSVSELLVQKTGITHIAMGDLLRYDKEIQAKYGKEINPIIQKGQFVPDELTIEIINHKLEQLGDHTSFLLDGYPRTIYQTKAILNITNITGIIHVVLDDEKIIARLSQRRVCACGATYNIKTKPPKVEGICDFDGKPLIHRKDDTPEVLKERLKIYKNKTEPVLALLKEKKIPILAVDGGWDIKTESDALINKIIAWQKAVLEQ